MTLRDYWDVARRSWWIILGTTLIGALVALALSMAATKEYQAKAQLFVSVKSADEVASAYSGGMFVQQRVKSYVDIIDAPGVLDPVIEGLDLDTDAASLSAQISAQAPANTVLINVMASDTNPVMARDLANSAAKALARQIVRLETTESGEKPVKAELIKPAQEPSTPSSPKTLLNVMLGALLGLLAGIGIAVLRHLLDTTVKTTEELEQAAGATSLGTVRFDPEAANSPLVTLRGSARAEAFRTIRTNLRYVDVDNPARCVVITSSIPGEGKSTTACNLAIALAQAGAKVLLVEADLRRPKVAEYLGVDGQIGLTDILIGQVSPAQAVVPWNRGLMDFLPSGSIPPNPSELLGSQHMSDLLKVLLTRYDTVILDAPPLLPVTDAAVLTTAADGAILIARYGAAKREQVQESADALRQIEGRLLGTVLNFAPSKRRGKYGYGGDYGYDYGYGHSHQAESQSEEQVASGRRVLSPEEVATPQPRV